METILQLVKDAVAFVTRKHLSVDHLLDKQVAAEANFGARLHAAAARVEAYTDQVEKAAAAHIQATIASAKAFAKNLEALVEHGLLSAEDEAKASSLKAALADLIAKHT